MSYSLSVRAAASPGALVEQGNQAYQQGNYLAAIDQYDLALTDTPKSTQPKFNKADSYYRLNDYDKAVDLYQEVAADAKDMALVEKARYNLGNCLFQKGLKQRDSDLQQSVTDLKDAIGHWRKALDINKDNQKAARNIEVARLTIKDIMDQINQQQKQKDPNHPQDPNQSQSQPQKQQTQQQPSQDPNQSKSGGTDANEPDNKSKQAQQKEASSENPAPDPNQSPQSPSQANQQHQRPIDQDMTAQAILDNEQRQKQQRRMQQRAAYQKVDKDW